MKKLLFLLSTFAIVNARQMDTHMSQKDPMINQPKVLGGWAGLSPIAKNEIKTSDVWKNLAYEHIDATEQQLYQLYLAQINQPTNVIDYGKVIQPSQQEDSINKVLPVFGPVAPPAAPMAMQNDMMMNNTTQPMTEVEKLYIQALQAQKLSQQEFDHKLQVFRMELQANNVFSSNPVSTAPMSMPMANGMMNNHMQHTIPMNTTNDMMETMQDTMPMHDDTTMLEAMETPEATQTTADTPSMQDTMSMENDMQQPMIHNQSNMMQNNTMAATQNSTTTMTPDMKDHNAMMKKVNQQNTMMNNTSMQAQEPVINIEQNN